MTRARPSIALALAALLLTACGRGSDDELMRRVAQAEAAATKAEAAQRRAEQAAAKAGASITEAAVEEDQDFDEDDDDADEDFNPDAQIFDNDIVSPPPRETTTVITEAAPAPIQG